ncbi:MAG TPA: phosphatidylserine decarboxylase [Telmatospirillum sp.]|nr:phosphatidylserine decarboxylase [Telmatospirillum sp.]
MQTQDSSVLKSLAMPIHPEGWRFIPLFAAATLLLFWLWSPLGWLGVVLTLWCAFFFRNPDRITPSRDGLVISPADGVVQMVVAAPPPLELAMGDAPMTRISIFMNVFNVHVNRAPISGKVLKRIYSPGKFFNASLDKASVFNERMAVRLELADGRNIAFVQIAGLIARRIRCDLGEGQQVRTGERFGLIRFGSRVDVYLPEAIQPLVVVGQTTVAGETVLADLTATEPARQGEAR